MTAFLIIGGLGLFLLVSSLFLGDLLPFDGFDLDAGDVLSGPVIGVFFAALGFGGALVSSTGAPAAVAAAAGAAGGVGLGFVAWRLTRLLMDMETDEPVRTTDLKGKSARVLTGIPAGGYGEISVRHAGQNLKLNGRSDTAIAAGTPVVIMEITSPSSVRVAPERDVFGELS